MAPFQGEAVVFNAEPYFTPKSKSTKSKVSHDSQELSSFMGALRDLAPDAPREGQPSLKRRKIEHGKAVNVYPQADFDEKSSIVLAKVSIELVGVHSTSVVLY
jgi:hypothetical protein